MYGSGEPRNVYYQNKATKIIHSLRKAFPHYEQYSDRTLLNLSFRQGDELHSQWTSNEEAYILPFLVHTGAKPLACVVVQKNTKHHANQLCRKVQKLCKDMNWNKVNTKVILNAWNVYVIVLFQHNSNNSLITNNVGSISNNIIYNIVNETASWNIMGKFYGYNDEIYDSTNIEPNVKKDRKEIL